MYYICVCVCVCVCRNAVCCIDLCGVCLCCLCMCVGPLLNGLSPGAVARHGGVRASQSRACPRSPENPLEGEGKDGYAGVEPSTNEGVDVDVGIAVLLLPIEQGQHQKMLQSRDEHCVVGGCRLWSCLSSSSLCCWFGGSPGVGTKARAVLLLDGFQGGLPLFPCLVVVGIIIIVIVIVIVIRADSTRTCTCTCSALGKGVTVEVVRGGTGQLEHGHQIHVVHEIPDKTPDYSVRGGGDNAAVVVVVVVAVVVVDSVDPPGTSLQKSATLWSVLQAVALIHPILALVRA